MQLAGMVGVAYQVKQSRSLVTPVEKPVGKHRGKFQEHDEFGPDCQTAVTAHDQHGLWFGFVTLLIASAFPPFVKLTEDGPSECGHRAMCALGPDLGSLPPPSLGAGSWPSSLPP